MARFPHELRREGLFAHEWSLKGTVLSGRFQPPRGDRPGVYQSATLRLEYRPTERRHGVEFQSPFLSRDGDRISGQARLGHTNRWVKIASRGTGAEGVTMQVVRSGLLRRKNVLIAPHGAPVATIVRKGAHFEVDIPSATFAPGEKGRGGHGKARLFEAAIAMVLAAKLDVEMRRRNAMAGAAASAAGAAAAGATVHAVHKRRKDHDGKDA